MKIRKKSTTRSGTFFHTIYHFILITAFWIPRMVWMIPVAFLFTMMVTMIIIKIRKKSTTRSGTFFHTIYHFILITAFWFLRMVGMIWLRITRMVWMIPVAFLFTMM